MCARVSDYRMELTPVVDICTGNPYNFFIRIFGEKNRKLCLVLAKRYLSTVYQNSGKGGKI